MIVHTHQTHAQGPFHVVQARINALKKGPVTVQKENIFFTAPWNVTMGSTAQQNAFRFLLLDASLDRTRQQQLRTISTLVNSIHPPPVCLVHNFTFFLICIYCPACNLYSPFGLAFSVQPTFNKKKKKKLSSTHKQPKRELAQKYNEFMGLETVQRKHGGDLILVAG